MASDPITFQVTIDRDDAQRLGLGSLIISSFNVAPEWVTPDEAATLLGCSRKNIYYLIKSGRLEAKRIGPKALRVRRESLLA